MLPNHRMRVTHQPVGEGGGGGGVGLWVGLPNENDRDARCLRKVEIAYFSLT